MFNSYALHPPRSPTWGRFNRDFQIEKRSDFLDVFRLCFSISLDE